MLAGKGKALHTLGLLRGWGFLKVLFFVVGVGVLSACTTFRKAPSPVGGGQPAPEGALVPEALSPLKLGLFISDAGGLKTLTLIPVLKLFQEKQLHFDYIAGTGWGAWLGALFAKNQNTNLVEWSLFKLKQKEVFEVRLFSNRRKQAQALSFNIQESLDGKQKTGFMCPALNSRGQAVILGKTNPAHAVLSCLNFLPPFGFEFPSTPFRGSVFSADMLLKQLKSQGVEVILWLKGPLECVLADKNRKARQNYWLELIHHLNRLAVRSDPSVFVFDLSKATGFDPCRQDSQGLDMVFRSYTEKEFQRLERFLISRAKKISQGEAQGGGNKK